MNNWRNTRRWKLICQNRKTKNFTNNLKLFWIFIFSSSLFLVLCVKKNPEKLDRTQINVGFSNIHFVINSEHKLVNHKWWWEMRDILVHENGQQIGKTCLELFWEFHDFLCCFSNLFSFSFEIFARFRFSFWQETRKLQHETQNIQKKTMKCKKKNEIKLFYLWTKVDEIYMLHISILLVGHQSFVLVWTIFLLLLFGFSCRTHHLELL